MDRESSYTVFCFVLGKSNGKYALMVAYILRRGDTVRLLSPKVQGENCLSFKYHMYGGTMGSLIIYMKTNSIETVQWIKSGNHPDHWFEAVVFLNSSVEYQVTLFPNGAQLLWITISWLRDSHPWGCVECSRLPIQDGGVLCNSKKAFCRAFYILDRPWKVSFK